MLSPSLFYFLPSLPCLPPPKFTTYSSAIIVKDTYKQTKIQPAEFIQCLLHVYISLTVYFLY